MERCISPNVRPQKLTDYIGQPGISREISISLGSARMRNDAFPHTLMFGPPGLGKTTLAKIIANEMDVPFISVLASGIQKESTLEELLMKLPIDGYDEETGKLIDYKSRVPGIIFMDEIHNLKKSLTETLHTALEDFSITLRKKNILTNKIEAIKYWIPRFTLIGATNYLGNLPKPFIDRFPLKLTFEAYSDDSMISIVEFASNKMGLNISERAREEIAIKSRGVPRIANSFLTKTRDVAVVEENNVNPTIRVDHVSKMFEIQSIDNKGLTRLDKKVLKYLAKVSRPMGLDTIAQAVDEDSITICNVVEPWLVRLNLIVRTKQGRQITPEGIGHIDKRKSVRRELGRIS